jgi:hypothetical protein
MNSLLYHIGDLVVFNYKDTVEHLGLIDSVVEDFYGDTIYSVVVSFAGESLYIRHTYILRLAYN